MKKLMTLAAVILLSTTAVTYAATTETTVQQPVQSTQNYHGQRPPKGEFRGQKSPKGPDFEKRKAEFEQRLNLTDEQKKKAEQLRKDGFEKAKPVMEKIKEKKQEAYKLKTQGSDSAKLEELNKQIQALKKEAHEMRMQNMKDFESILDKKQLKELNTMKEEGRKKFEAARKQRINNGMPPRPPKDME